MKSGGFYRYIVKFDSNTYGIVKGDERYGTYNRVEDALYERDRLIAVDWDWDLYVELPETNNNYIHIDLPPFTRQPSYITVVKGYWTVRSKGKSRKYRGSYKTEEEAMEVARIYDGYVTYTPTRYRVNKRFNGVEKSFGYYKTWDEAEQRVKELMENNWQ